MPDYTQPFSEDTPCLELPADKVERDWLAMHLGHTVVLVKREGEILLECTTCDAYLIATEDTVWGEEDTPPGPDDHCVVCGLPFSSLGDPTWVELECGDGYAHTGIDCYGEHCGGCGTCPIGGDA